MNKYPSPIVVIVGKTYTLHDSETGENRVHILAQVFNYQFCLISLDNGNRYNDPISVDGYKMYFQIPFSSEIVKKIFECNVNQYWTIGGKIE